MTNLHDKVVWVTGAGSGVGRSTAILFAGQGARVALIGRRRESVEQVLAEIEGEGADTVAETVDVGNRAQVSAMAESLLQRWGRVDILVNNAGSNVPERRFNVVRGEDFDRMVQTNLIGTYNMIQAVLPAMRAQERGTIVNVASMAGKQAYPMSGPGYCSSKFGMVGLSHTVNTEEWRHGIRSTALCPGEIDTPFVDRRNVTPGAEDRAQMLQPEDVAETIYFLSSMNQRCTVSEMWMVPTVQRPPLPGETI